MAPKYCSEHSQSARLTLQSTQPSALALNTSEQLDNASPMAVQTTTSSTVRNCHLPMTSSRRSCWTVLLFICLCIISLRKSCALPASIGITASGQRLILHTPQYRQQHHQKLLQQHRSSIQTIAPHHRHHMHHRAIDMEDSNVIEKIEKYLADSERPFADIRGFYKTILGNTIDNDAKLGELTFKINHNYTKYICNNKCTVDTDADTDYYEKIKKETCENIKLGNLKFQEEKEKIAETFNQLTAYTAKVNTDNNNHSSEMKAMMGKVYNSVLNIHGLISLHFGTEKAVDMNTIDVEQIQDMTVTNILLCREILNVYQVTRAILQGILEHC